MLVLVLRNLDKHKRESYFFDTGGLFYYFLIYNQFLVRTRRGGAVRRLGD